MQDYELDAYLGDTEATAEQKAALLAASDTLAARYPDPDLQTSVEAAFSAAAQVILGDDTLDTVAQEWKRALAAERDAMLRLTGAIAASAAEGIPETVIAETASVDRQTVRKALGKK